MSNSVSNEKIYLDYKDRVAGYVGARVVDPFAAEDIVSKVFLKVYKNIESYDSSRASLSTWIYSITRNTVIDYYKAKKTQSVSLDEVAATIDIPDEPSACAELLNDLATALEKLPERERDLIVLHYYEGHTLKRVAEIMGMSYINAKVVHAKALSVLRAFFDRY